MVAESLENSSTFSISKKNNTIKNLKSEALAKKLHNSIKLHYLNSSLDKNASQDKVLLVVVIS